MPSSLPSRCRMLAAACSLGVRDGDSESERDIYCSEGLKMCVSGGGSGVGGGDRGDVSGGSSRYYSRGSLCALIHTSLERNLIRGCVKRQNIILYCNMAKCGLE